MSYVTGSLLANLISKNFCTIIPEHPVLVQFIHLEDSLSIIRHVGHMSVSEYGLNQSSIPSAIIISWLLRIFLKLKSSPDDQTKLCPTLDYVPSSRRGNMKL